MKALNRAFAPLVGLALALAVPGSAAGGVAEITALAAKVDHNRALVSFRLTDAIDRRFVDRVQSGLPTGFVYRLELLKDRKRWYDRPLESTTLEVAAMYDALSREYLVNYKLAGKLVESRMVSDLAALEQALTTIDELPAFDLDGLPRSWRLLVRVRAELGGRTLFSFIPLHITTDWRESNKIRAPNDLDGDR